MVMGRGWYVKGTKLAWPNGTRLCSGPFDDQGAAFAEMRRIRPFYPDANLWVQLEVAKTLPERKPRSAPPGDEPMRDVPAFDMSKPQGRRDAAAAIADHVRALGCDVTTEAWERDEFDVDARVPLLGCNLWIAWTPAAPMPIISWRAARPGPCLRDALAGAWSTGGTLKATSTPDTWPALFDALEIGLLAGIDGSAFDLTP